MAGGDSPYPLMISNVNKNMQKDFSLSECYAVGWVRFKEHAWFLILTMVFMYGTAIFFDVLIEEHYRTIEPTRTLLSLLATIFFYWLYLGFTSINFKIVDRQPVVWRDLFVFDSRFPIYLLGSLFYGVIVVLGMLFFIVPGIYLAIRYGFYWYAILDGHKSLGAAFAESARITHGVKWKLVLFVFTAFGVSILGVLLLGVGILVAIPLISLASVHLYRVLLAQSDSLPKDSSLPETPARVNQDSDTSIHDSSVTVPQTSETVDPKDTRATAS